MKVLIFCLAIGSIAATGCIDRNPKWPSACKMEKETCSKLKKGGCNLTLKKVVAKASKLCQKKVREKGDANKKIYEFCAGSCTKCRDGQWSAWESSQCTKTTKTCGSDGTQTKTRTCNNPVPAGGGNKCVGSPSETIGCGEWKPCHGSHSMCTQTKCTPSPQKQCSDCPADACLHGSQCIHYNPEWAYPNGPNRALDVVSYAKACIENGGTACSESNSASICPRDYFLCANEKCLEASKICDNQNDCGDNSDEGKLCSDFPTPGAKATPAPIATTEPKATPAPTLKPTPAPKEEKLQVRVLQDHIPYTTSVSNQDILYQDILPVISGEILTVYAKDNANATEDYRQWWKATNSLGHSGWILRVNVEIVKIEDDCKDEIPSSCLSGLKSLSSFSSLSSSSDVCKRLYQMSSSYGNLCDFEWKNVEVHDLDRSRHNASLICDNATPGKVKDTCKSSCNICGTPFIRSRGRCMGNKFRHYDTSYQRNHTYPGSVSADQCKSRCGVDPDCTGYSVPINGNTCTTYKVVGITGDGWRNEWNYGRYCYAKRPFYVNQTRIVSGPDGYITLDKSFLIPSATWRKGFKCLSTLSSRPSTFIINEYEDAVDYCTTQSNCLGFIDHRCDGKGPFVICGDYYTAEPEFETCLIAKRDRIYNSTMSYY